MLAAEDESAELTSLVCVGLEGVGYYSMSAYTAFLQYYRLRDIREKWRSDLGKGVKYQHASHECRAYGCELIWLCPSKHQHADLANWLLQASLQ